MKANFVFIIACLVFSNACNSSTQSNEKNDPKVNAVKNDTSVVQNSSIASAAEILAKKQVPVLCFHHIKELKPGQRATESSYSVTPVQLADLMKALKDSGYQTILPDQLYNYLVHGAVLPPKPVMLTFDDTDEEQFTIGNTYMKKYGFKGVFFIMTVSLNRPRYMTTDQLKQLSAEGNAVESHTWDHHMVTKYQGNDWNIQFVQPKKKIEGITGKSADYFAYPYGLWNRAAFPELKKAGYKMAFSLSTKRDSTQPLYTIRRMIVSGTWSTKGTMNSMIRTFNVD